MVKVAMNICVCVCGGGEGKREVVSNLRYHFPQLTEKNLIKTAHSIDLVTPYKCELQNILN